MSIVAHPIIPGGTILTPVTPIGTIVDPSIPGYGFAPDGYGLDPYGDPYAAPPPDSDIPPIDHILLGLARVIQQYRESQNFLALLVAILSESNEMESILTSLQQLPNINLMEGANLDVIGRIVGANRLISNVVSLFFFGFDEGYSYMLQFGEEGNPAVGARFYEEGESFSGTNTLADPEFRLIIHAKIVKNQSRGTGEDVIAALRYMFNSTVTVTDNEDMSFTVSIGRPFTATENAILSGVDILPRPAGVRLIIS